MPLVNVCIYLYINPVYRRPAGGRHPAPPPGLFRSGTALFACLLPATLQIPIFRAPSSPWGVSGLVLRIPSTFKNSDSVKDILQKSLFRMVRIWYALSGSLLSGQTRQHAILGNPGGVPGRSRSIGAIEQKKDFCCGVAPVRFGKPS